MFVVVSTVVSAVCAAVAANTLLENNEALFEEWIEEAVASKECALERARRNEAIRSLAQESNLDSCALENKELAAFLELAIAKKKVTMIRKLRLRELLKRDAKVRRWAMVGAGVGCVAALAYKHSVSGVCE